MIRPKVKDFKLPIAFIIFTVLAVFLLTLVRGKIDLPPNPPSGKISFEVNDKMHGVMVVKDGLIVDWEFFDKKNVD